MLAAVLPTTDAFKHWRWPPKIDLYIFVHRVEGLAPGLYALPRDHDALEPLQAATLTDFDWQKVAEVLPLYHLYSGECRQTAKTVFCHQLPNSGLWNLPARKSPFFVGLGIKD
jgi:hypothetical protein